MLFDTDVLIWVFRGNGKAASLVEGEAERAISVITYIELLQGARDKHEARAIKGFLAEQAFDLLPLTENIGHRAAIYMEEYALKAGMRMADALIAATAVENGVTLCTADRKRYRPINDLTLRVFRP